MSTLSRAQKVAQAASRIFGTHIGNGLQSGRKELRKNLAGPKIMSWYQRPIGKDIDCLLYTSPSPRDQRGSRMPSSA